MTAAVSVDGSHTLTLIYGTYEDPPGPDNQDLKPQTNLNLKLVLNISLNPNISPHTALRGKNDESLVWKSSFPGSSRPQSRCVCHYLKDATQTKVFSPNFHETGSGHVYQNVS